MPAINGAVVGAGAPPPAVNPAHLHARYTVPKIQFIYSQKRNYEASVTIPTFMCLSAINIFLDIYKSLTDK
jgi:hypothetical protein